MEPVRLASRRCRRARAHSDGTVRRHFASGIILPGRRDAQGLDRRRARKPACRYNAEDPLSSVVLGAGKMLSDFDLLRRISLD